MMKATADLVDEYADILKSCSIQFRDIGARKRFFGPVRTVRCFRDNQLIKSLLNEPGDGAVLVVDGGGSLESALMGDMMAAAGLKNGWAGCVIYGAVRDVTTLASLDFGIKAVGVNPLKSAKLGEGVVDAEIEFGGVRFALGHWIYCDEDGLVVAPHKLGT